MTPNTHARTDTHTKSWKEDYAKWRGGSLLIQSFVASVLFSVETVGRPLVFRTTSHNITLLWDIIITHQERCVIKPLLGLSIGRPSQQGGNVLMWIVRLSIISSHFALISNYTHILYMSRQVQKTPRISYQRRALHKVLSPQISVVPKVSLCVLILVKTG